MRSSEELFTADYADIDTMTKEELEEYIKIAEEQEHKFDKKQHAVKILLNSLYGALGTPYFRFFNIHCAEAITLTGQATTAQSFKLFNDFLNGILGTDKDYAIASDTDSVYLDLSDLIDKLYGDAPPQEIIDPVTKLCDTKFADMLEECFDKFAHNINSMRNAIDMKREAIGSAVFVAKKNYVMQVYDNEGVRYATPQQKITGLEAIKSSTPKFFQEKLKEGYKLLFQGDESKIHEFVSDVYTEAMKLTPDDVAGVSTANNIETFDNGDGTYKKGTPKHIKGALAYNRLIKNSDIYQPINSGEKVYVIQLKEPNPLNTPVLAYNERFPSDLLDEKYVDKELDYEKYFIKPLTRTLDILQWTPKHEVSLEDLFA